MKKIFTVLIILLLGACGTQPHSAYQTKEKNYAIISGKVTSLEEVRELSLFHNAMGVFREIPVSPDGSFRDTLSVMNCNHTYYILGFVALPLYIDNRTNIDLSLSQDLSQVTVSGAQAEQTRYLIERERLLRKRIYNDRGDLFRQEPEEFKKNLKEFFGELGTKLEGYRFGEEFLRDQKNWFKYMYVKILMQYPNSHRHHINKKVTLPKDFYKERDQINFDNAQEFDCNKGYRDMVITRYLDPLSTDPENPETIERFIKSVREVKSENIRALFAKELALRIRPGNTKNKEILDFVLDYTKDEKIKKEAQETYEKITEFR